MQALLQGGARAVERLTPAGKIHADRIHEDPAPRGLHRPRGACWGYRPSMSRSRRLSTHSGTTVSARVAGSIPRHLPWLSRQAGFVRSDPRAPGGTHPRAALGGLLTVGVRQQVPEHPEQHDGQRQVPNPSAFGLIASGCRSPV
jgi:hypothetical protein